MRSARPRLAAISLATVLVGAGAVSADIIINATNKSIPSPDAEALSEFYAYQDNEDNQPIWPGVTLAHQPVYLLSRESGYGYLINPDKPVSSPFFTHLDEEKYPNTYRTARLTPSAIPTRLTPGDFPTTGSTPTVAGNEVYFLKFDEGNFTAPRSSEHFMAYLAHESFHFYGQDTWALHSSINQELSAEGLALLRQRLDILDAVRAELRTPHPNPESLQPLASELLDLQRQRREADPTYVDQEEWRETVEGTAQFVGNTAATRVGYPLGIMDFNNRGDVPFDEVMPVIDSGKKGTDFLATHFTVRDGGDDSGPPRRSIPDADVAARPRGAGH